MTKHRAPTAPALSALRVDRLRPLTLDPRLHPRGQPHLSAASGLVCVRGHAWVLGDDELHVAAYHDRRSAGLLHRVAPGALPDDAAQRKKRKCDFETLMWLPQLSALVGLGSGSRAGRRDRGFMLRLDDAGLPLAPACAIDLQPVYAPLRERLVSINIEGAFVDGGRFRLLNRGQAAGAGNLLVDYPLEGFLRVMSGSGPSKLEPTSQSVFNLGHIDDVPLGFTDAAPLGRDGGWLYSAVAEATDNSFDDGEFRGSVLGLVGADGHPRWQRRLVQAGKVEGLDVQARRGGMAVFMTTDADDPAQAAWLLSARIAA